MLVNAVEEKLSMVMRGFSRALGKVEKAFCWRGHLSRDINELRVCAIFGEWQPCQLVGHEKTAWDSHATGAWRWWGRNRIRVLITGTLWANGKYLSVMGSLEGVEQRSDNCPVSVWMDHSILWDDGLRGTRYKQKPVRHHRSQLEIMVVRLAVLVWESQTNVA